MSFNRHNIRTARKEHTCYLCHKKISINEKYHDKAGNSFNDDSKIYSVKECDACQSVIVEFCEYTKYEVGYSAVYIRDWWLADKCTKCKNYCYAKKGVEEICTVGSILRDSMTHYCRCENFDKAVLQ